MANSTFAPNEVTLICTLDSSRVSVNAKDVAGTQHSTRSFASRTLVKQLADKIVACVNNGTNFTLSLSDKGNIVED